MTETLRYRIDKMFGADRLWAYGFVVFLWLTYAFVLYAVQPYLPKAGSIDTALLIAGGIVLLFNTAAVIAMINHYSEDRNFIYEIDIRHLDEGRAHKTP